MQKVCLLQAFNYVGKGKLLGIFISAIKINCRNNGFKNVFKSGLFVSSPILKLAVTEQKIFSYPGLGAATSAAGTGGTDIPLFLGIVLFTAIFIFVGNLIANILYQVIDPQTREGAKK